MNHQQMLEQVTANYQISNQGNKHAHKAVVQIIDDINKETDVNLSMHPDSVFYRNLMQKVLQAQHDVLIEVDKKIAMLKEEIR